MGTQTINQTVTNQNSLPSWYESYLQNVMGRAVGASGEAYQAYTGPRNAALTADQQQAYDQVRASQGHYQSMLTGSGNALIDANNVDFTGPGGAGAGDASIAQGIGQIGDAGQRDTASSMLPYAQQGLGYLAQSADGSALANANPYIAASTSPTGLAAASPFLGMAGQSTANVSDYMNPYNSAVTDRIAQLGARNLSENILPGIGDNFVKAGQFGSGRQADITGRAIRDTQDSILAQQNQALDQGYTQAQSAAQADAARYAQLANTAGGLGTAQQQALLGAGQATGQLSSSDLSRLQAAGVDISQIGSSISAAQAQDAARALAAGQSIGQLGISQGQLGLSAAQAQANNYLNVSQGANALATNAQNIDLKGAAALETAGQAQQNQTQQNYNTAYNDFTEQKNQPWTEVGLLSNVIQGLPSGTTAGSSTSNSTTTQPGPSTTGQIAGIGLGIAGLANSGLFKAKGGSVKKPKPRQNASYGNMPRRGIAIAA